MFTLCRDGSEPELPAVATGSHVDAIPFSGKYDGVVGVLGALEAINVLKRLVTFSNSHKRSLKLKVCLLTATKGADTRATCASSLKLFNLDELIFAMLLKN